MQLKNKVLLLHHQNVIELWCNGNTTDSGPVILGSNPGSSTEKRGIILAFFILSPDSSVSICETPRRSSTANRHCGKNRTADFHNARPRPAAVSKLGAQTPFDFCFPSCLTRRNAVRLYCTGDMKNSSGIVQGAGYTRKSDASGKSVRI